MRIPSHSQGPAPVPLLPGSSPDSPAQLFLLEAEDQHTRIGGGGPRANSPTIPRGSLSQTMQSLRKQPGSSPAPSSPQAQASWVVSCAFPGHLGSLQPGAPHPPMALSPESWPQISTLSPRMWPQRLALGHDQQRSPPPPPPQLPREREPNGTQPVCNRAPPRQNGRQGCCGESPAHREMQHLPPTAAQTRSAHAQTPTPSTLPGARKQSHSNSETHGHRHTDATPRSHTVGQGETHKYTKRCRDGDTKGDTNEHACEGEARGTNVH